MDVLEIRRGLWRWTVALRVARAEPVGGLSREVGSLDDEAGDALVQFDPRLPPNRPTPTLAAIPEGS